MNNVASNIYLILHKVRGEPAFDIAEPARIGDEEAWIISTSGHRAYPLDKWPLSTAIIPSIRKCLQHASNLTGWDDLRDHYMQPAPATPKRETVRRALNKLSAQEIDSILEAIKELSK